MPSFPNPFSDGGYYKEERNKRLDNILSIEFSDDNKIVTVSGITSNYFRKIKHNYKTGQIISEKYSEIPQISPLKVSPLQFAYDTGLYGIYDKIARTIKSIKR